MNEYAIFDIPKKQQKRKFFKNWKAKENHILYIFDGFSRLLDKFRRGDVPVNLNK